MTLLCSSLGSSGLLAANLLSQCWSLVFGFSTVIQAHAAQRVAHAPAVSTSPGCLLEIQNLARCKTTDSECSLLIRSPVYSYAHECLRNTALTQSIPPCVCAANELQVCSEEPVLTAFRWLRRVTDSFPFGWDFPNFSIERTTSLETS